MSPTTQTFRSVNTDQISTNNAGPAAILITDELHNTGFFNLQQVLYHTHAVIRTISLIETFQSLTRKGRTGIITVFTLPLITETYGTCPAAFGFRCQTAITSIPFSDISDAKPAVHTTWRYLKCLDTCLHFKSD
jgi:hypothetical protein